MSSLFSKKYLNEQQIQEGQVPDDISDQSHPIHPHQPEEIKDDKKHTHDEEQFIFETVPIHELEDQFTQKDKSNYRHDYYQQNTYNQKKDWDRNDREKNNEKSQKSIQKKQYQNAESKPKPEPEDTRQPLINAMPGNPGNIGYYSNIPPLLSNPYAPPGVNPYYPPGYPMQQPNMIQRPPYGIYHPSLHHPPPPTTMPGNMYIPNPSQNPYQISNPHLYQMSQPVPMPYGAPSMIQPSISDLYNRPQQRSENISQKDHQGSYQYDQSQHQSLTNKKPQNTYNQHKQNSYKDLPRQRQETSYQRQKYDYKQKSQDRYDQRQRSRDRKDYYDQQRTQKKQRYEDNKNYQRSNKNYQNTSKQRQRSNQGENYRSENKGSKSQKISLIQEEKSKYKKQINQFIKVLFDNSKQEAEEFLFILRDIFKYKLLRKEQDQLTIQQNNMQMPNYQKKRPFYTLTKQLIAGNYQKALLKLEKIIITQSQVQKVSSTVQSKKQALVKILQKLELEELFSKIKQMRLRKKLIGQKKMSQIKKLLQQLVKDPRKKVK